MDPKIYSEGRMRVIIQMKNTRNGTRKSKLRALLDRVRRGHERPKKENVKNHNGQSKTKVLSADIVAVAGERGRVDSQGGLSGEMA